MTRQEFQDWAKYAARSYKADGPVCVQTRHMAGEVRPHDPALAKLYETLAAAGEAIRAHLVQNAG